MLPTGATSDKRDRLLRLAANLEAILARPQSPEPRHTPTRQRQRRLNDAEVALLLDGYRSGATMEELALQWRVSRWTVAAHLQRTGVEARRSTVRGLDDEQEILRLYNEGWTCAQLAQRYSCHRETVARLLRRHGVTRRRGRNGNT